MEIKKQGRAAPSRQKRRRRPLLKNAADAAGSGRCQRIFILDDDGDVVKTMGDVMEADDYTCRHLTNQKRCLSELVRTRCDVLLVDADMRSSDHIAFLGKVRELKPWLPVIVISDCDTVRHAVTAIKNGASHFITKPVDRLALLDSIVKTANTGELSWANMPEVLTRSERLVLGWVLRGYSNPQIAEILEKSVRTVEDQRRRVMRKLEVDNVVDLVKLCIRVGILASSRGRAMSETSGDASE